MNKTGYTVGDGLVAIAIAVAFIGYFYITHHSKRRRLEMIHQERLIAMEKGIPLLEIPLELIEPPKEPDRTILPIMGIVFTTLSVGAMVVMLVNSKSFSGNFWLMPLPLAFLGIGLLAFHFLKGMMRL